MTVEAPALRSSVRGDTLSYRASAYKVSFGADAESLISKMPGLEVADGGIEAQGRTVQRIYVDGREFFGNDVMSAIRNIPADMIESIDIYNSQSDQSEFTGVDTGEGHTSLNIVTLPDKRRGAFGRLYGAYGIADKYIGGGNVNIFDNDRRISVVGLANNISRQNFSFEDILGTTDRSGRKSPNNSFMVRPLDGISTVQAIGVNYSDDWGAKGKVTASYFFNRTDNRNTSQSDRQTFTSTDKLVLYNDENRSKTLNLNHRFNSRIDYKFSDRHSVMMRTSFSLQDNNSRNELRSRTDNKFSDDDIRFVYRRRNFGHNNSDGYNVSNYLLYRYRLPGAKSHNLTVGAGEPTAAEPPAAVHLPRPGQHRVRHVGLLFAQHHAHRPRPAGLRRERQRELHPFALETLAPELRIPHQLHRQQRRTQYVRAHQRERLSGRAQPQAVHRIRLRLPDPPHRQYVPVLFQKDEERSTTSTPPSAATTPFPMRGRPRRRSTT